MSHSGVDKKGIVRPIKFLCLKYPQRLLCAIIIIERPMKLRRAKVILTLNFLLGSALTINNLA